MGSVIKLSKKINNSYLELKKSVEDKLVMVDERVEQKLQSNVDLVKKMSKICSFATKLCQIIIYSIV